MRSSLKKQRRFAIGRPWLVLVGVLVSLVLLEGGARIWLAFFATPEDVKKYTLHTDLNPEAFQLSAHPYLNYFPTPNYKDGSLSHNSLGFRGAEFPIEKPPGEFRIVTLGGSTTYTNFVNDDQETYPARLEQVLHSRYEMSHVRVINAGVPGYTSWESLANLVFRVVALDPDLVIVYHATNDVHARIVEPAAYTSDNLGKVSHWEAPPIPWFEHSVLVRVYSRRAGITRQAGLGDYVNAPSYLAGRYFSKSYEPDDLAPEEFEMWFLEENPPVFFEHNIRSMIGVAEQHRFDILLTTWAHTPAFADYAATPLYRQGYREHNAIMAMLGQETHAWFFDFAGEMSPDPQYWVDGRHVNEAGAHLKAELFAAFIAENGLIDG